MKGLTIMKRKRCYGFTLAEVLITLAIIGVVAALSIPAVISNSQQQEFKTGLRKAVSVLNSAITMNMALDGESPYDNANLFGYLMKHMAVMESTTNLAGKYIYKIACSSDSAINGYCIYRNAAFYTTDGMRFEFQDTEAIKLYLYENPSIKLTSLTYPGRYNTEGTMGRCGSYGLNSNPDNTTKQPCVITIDVNGDKKPNPANIYCKNEACATALKTSDPSGLKLMDIFSIMITDKQAIPYGVAAQRAMYQAQK